MTDSQLIREIVEGNVELFEEVIKRYERKLLAFVFQLLKSAGMESVAEDLCQETFYKAFRSLHLFREGEASFATWLYTIARNSVISELRKNRTSSVTLDDAAYQLAAPADHTPENKTIRQETVSRVRDAINNLPDKQRSALILREYDQLEYHEIATILGQTVSSVKSLLFRARAGVKTQMESYISGHYSGDYERMNGQ